MTPLLTDTLESPLGCLVLVFDAGRLCLLDYADNTERNDPVVAAALSPVPVL